MRIYSGLTFQLALYIVLIVIYDDFFNNQIILFSFYLFYWRYNVFDLSTVFILTKPKSLAEKQMLANYGYTDASGSFFITIDTDKCDGCGNCIYACPANIFEVVEEDPNDPLREMPVAIVSDKKKRSLKYECNPCKSSSVESPLPCIKACSAVAISHSW